MDIRLGGNWAGSKPGMGVAGYRAQQQGYKSWSGASRVGSLGDADRARIQTCTGRGRILGGPYRARCRIGTSGARNLDGTALGPCFVTKAMIKPALGLKP